MKLIARIAWLVSVAGLAAHAQDAAKVEPLHFHHVHLNSIDPAAAAAYYPKPFAQSATKTTFNGFEAVKTGNIYILFTKVSAPPQNELTGPQTSVWHFGWNTPNSREYNEKFRAMGLTIAQMWDAADGKLVDLSSDTLPGFPTQEQILELRAKGVQPTRQGGFGYLRGPDGAMIENAQAGHDGALQPRAHVSRASALRDGLVRHAPGRDACRRAAAGAAAAPADGRRLPDEAVRAADLAVVREDRIRARPGGRREDRRHLDFDPAVAGRRAGQHARQARRSLGGEHGRSRRDGRAAETREREVPRRDSPVGQLARGDDRGADRIAIEIVEVK